jgi:uncharacterized protein YjiS (DUF1127 family)
VTMILLRELSSESSTPNCTPVPNCTPGGPGRPPKGRHRSWVLAWMREAWRRHRSRVYLSELDDHMLKDIGISRAEAECEANKLFWLP